MQADERQASARSSERLPAARVGATRGQGLLRAVLVALALVGLLAASARYLAVAVVTAVGAAIWLSFLLLRRLVEREPAEQASPPPHGVLTYRVRPGPQVLAALTVMMLLVAGLAALRVDGVAYLLTSLLSASVLTLLAARAAAAFVLGHRIVLTETQLTFPPRGFSNEHVTVDISSVHVRRSSKNAEDTHLSIEIDGRKHWLTNAWLGQRAFDDLVAAIEHRRGALTARPKDS